jgi:hypothetical protein
MDFPCKCEVQVVPLMTLSVACSLFFFLKIRIAYNNFNISLSNGLMVVINHVVAKIMQKQMTYVYYVLARNFGLKVVVTYTSNLLPLFPIVRRFGSSI